MPKDYEIDSVTSIRNNQDISINDYGQQLLDLFIAAKLRILNGRTRGDLQGQITYIGNKGHSIVGLMLVSEICLIESGLIQYLSVLDLNHLSDHTIVPYLSHFQVFIQSQLTHSETKWSLTMLH